MISNVTRLYTSQLTQTELRAVIAALNSRELHLATGTEKPIFENEVTALLTAQRKFQKDFEARVIRRGRIAGAVTGHKALSSEEISISEAIPKRQPRLPPAGRPRRQSLSSK